MTKITYSEKIDYEPLVVQLFGSEATLPSTAQLEQFVGDWLRSREQTPFCTTECRRKYLHIRVLDRTSIQLSIQWVCDQCIPQLTSAIVDRFPQISEIAIGLQDTIPVVQGESDWLSFAGRLVTFEDGHTEETKPFEICSKAVSVGAMSRFISEAHYVTSAEQAKALHTFKSNPFLHGVSRADLDAADARFLSFDDATAYCEWAKVRLPSEAEYMVAQLVDDAVHELTPNDLPSILASSKLLKVGGMLITSTISQSKIVYRSGPRIAKLPDWQSRLNHNRLLFDKSRPSGQVVPVKQH